MTNNFTTYYNRLMGMKKVEIIHEGQTWGFWDARESNTQALMKWSKILLARSVADRLVRLENCGY